MRDLFEPYESANPMAAARRGARPELRRRFYAKAAAAPTAEGQVVRRGVRLDDKPAHTPAHRVLAAPTLPLAQAIAAEWDAQGDVIDPATMPLTRLANAIIDGVTDAPGPVAAEIKKYLASDLLFYRAAAPAALCERQMRHWDPILVWACDALGAQFKTGEGIVHVAQPEAALEAAGAVIPTDPWRLGALHAVTTLTGSALLALALLRNGLSAEAAWRAAHIDEDWNIEKWGSDETALERRASRLAEFEAAAAVMKAMSA
jgi:chaperone required for assembly of F1-ATPase